MKLDSTDLKRGYVFHANLPTSDKEHACIIVTKVDTIENIISYVYIQSYDTIDKQNRIDVLMKNDSNALVVLEPKDISFLYSKPHTSCVCCDEKHINSLSVSCFNSMFSSKQARYAKVNYIPHELWGKINEGIDNSDTLDDEDKEYLLSEDH